VHELEAPSARPAPKGGRRAPAVANGPRPQARTTSAAVAGELVQDHPRFVGVHRETRAHLGELLAIVGDDLGDPSGRPALRIAHLGIMHV